MDEAKLILGIDPGLNITGYGVLDVSGHQPSMVEAGVVRTSRNDSMHQKLRTLHTGILDILNSFNVSAFAMEELYSHYERPKTAIIMGHARGVLCLAAAEKEVPFFSYAATQIKKMNTGNGRAPKSQIQTAVMRTLNLQQIPEPPDVADALAIALCHCYFTQRPASLT
ncbi:MAG: crossover junction endodeoxyribonuclease RuvC [Planctomycetota bacterium]